MGTGGPDGDVDEASGGAALEPMAVFLLRVRPGSAGLFRSRAFSAERLTDCALYSRGAKGKWAKGII